MRLELHFFAGEGARVPSLPAARAGRVEFLGMRLDPEAGAWVVADEASRVVIDGDHATTDLAALRKDVREGHLVPADAVTAEVFGVKLEPSAATPAPALGAPTDVAPEPAPSLESPPGPPLPAEGQGRAFLTPDSPDAQAFEPAPESPAEPRLGSKRGR